MSRNHTEEEKIVTMQYNESDPSYTEISPSFLVSQ